MAAAAPGAPPEVPPWLAERFPIRKAWSSLRACRLRVDDAAGAGLDLEEGDFGYRVEGVAEEPGQDAGLRAGDVIIAIGGERLWGLPGDELGEAFGRHFQPDAEILLLYEDEAKEAVIERDSNFECPCEEPDDAGTAIRGAVEASGNYELLRREKSSTEYPAVVRIPVSRKAVYSLDEEAKLSLDNDLAHLGEKFGLSAAAECDKFGNMERVVLRGVSSAIAAARSEVIHILDFYREGKWSTDPTVGSAQDTYQQEEGQEEPTQFSVPAHVKDLHQFKYHDHTADIIVHAWGQTQAEAFGEVVVGMFNYMTPLENVNFECAVEVEATGHDMLDLLYHLLDEFLFVFSTEMHVSRCVEMLEFNPDALRIRARGYGEKMKLSKHEQGTEIKAITMHMMKILGPEIVLTENGKMPRVKPEARDPEATDEGSPHEVYVLLDI